MYGIDILDFEKLREGEFNDIEDMKHSVKLAEWEFNNNDPNKKKKRKPFKHNL